MSRARMQVASRLEHTTMLGFPPTILARYPRFHRAHVATTRGTGFVEWDGQQQPK